MLVFGSLFAAFLRPTCGTNTGSADFRLYRSGEYRVLKGNSCPGYDWTSQSSPNSASAIDYKYKIPIAPRIRSSPKTVGLDNPELGTIGVAISGAQILGPSTLDETDAVKEEYDTFDQCGGHNSPLFYLPGLGNVDFGGQYHYHAMPGDGKPRSHRSTQNLDFDDYCSGVASWYGLTEETTSHSPLVGFMADGIPIYGPAGANGTLPDDLDSCNGHSGDGLDFYHYHFTSNYPYTVDCLSGCLNGEMNSDLDDGNSCTESGTQYDYSSLANYTASFGGGGGSNETDVVKPVCLLVFGFLILVSSIVACCLCERRAKDQDTQSHTNTALYELKPNASNFQETPRHAPLLATQLPDGWAPATSTRNSIAVPPKLLASGVQGTPLVVFDKRTTFCRKCLIVNAVHVHKSFPQPLRETTRRKIRGQPEAKTTSEIKPLTGEAISIRGLQVQAVSCEL